MNKKNNPAKVYLPSALFKKILFTFFAVITSLSSFAVAISSTGAGGAWNAGTTWVGGVVPTGNDDVTIVLSANVTVPAAGATCRLLTVNGNLTMTGTGISLTITNNSTTSAGLTLGSGSNLFIGPSNILDFTTTQGTGITNNGGTIASTGTNGADGGTIQVATCCGGNFTVSGSASTKVNNLKFLANANFNISSGGLYVNGTLSEKDNNFNASGSAQSPVYGPASTLSINNNNQGMTGPGPLNGNLSKLWSVQTGTIGVTQGYPNNVTLVNMGTSARGVNVPPTINVGWAPTGTVGLNGTLSLGDGTITGFGSLDQLTSFTCGGIIVDNGSVLVGPPAAATFIDKGNFILQGATTGLFYNYGATINFAGTGTSASPQIISTTGASITFPTMIVSNGTYVQLQDKVNITSTLTLTSGYVGTSATNSLIVTNTTNTAVSGGSAAAYVDGPLIWSLPASAGNYLFPVGSGANYLPFTLNKVASSALNTTVEAITPGSGGTVDATMSSLSTTEYWSLTTSAGLPAGSVVSISRPAAISPLAYIAESKTTSTGTYTSLAGTASTFGVSNSNDIGAGSTFFFTFGSPPIVSTLAASSIATSSVTLNGAFNTGSSKTTSFHYGLTTAYGTTVNSIHSPINSSTAKLDSQLVTGLTANTVYHYLATDGTDNGSDVVFVTAPNPPVMGAPNSPTTNGFTATWMAPASMGAAFYTYTVEVSSDPTFATGVITQTGISSGATSYTFNTLSSGTQYYYKVKAVNATASSVWSATSAPVSTIIVATAACTTGNGSPGTTGTISSAATAPVIDGNVDAVWATVPSNNITQKIGVADEGSGLQTTPNNTSTWKTIWDTNNLYILVQVTDASLVSQGNLSGATNISTLNGSPNLWDVDGIEFYLDGNNNKGGAYDNTNDFQMRFNLGSSTVTGIGNAPFSSLAPRISFSMVVTAGGYLLEAAIPWSGAGGVNSGAYPGVAAGNKIGIDFSINDNDGTQWRTAQQGWYDGLVGSVNQYNNTTLFGTATLATCPQPPTVILPTVTNITATGATLGATVTSSGDSPLAVRGTGYTASPTTTGTSNAVPEGGTGVSIYSGPPRTGLAPQTKYYYLGYATNTNGGTGVSNVASFYTLSALPTVQPVLSANACTQMILNWTSITFPPAAQATQTGYLVLRATAPALPATTGISTRVATMQSALSAGTTLVTTITSGATITYNDASAAAGITYNYILVPFTWDGVATDSTYNYFTTSPSAVSASISNLAAPGASATQQPTCATPTGIITISPWNNTLSYSVDGTNFLTGPTFSGLAPNTYNVVAKNSSGCVSSSTPVTINPTPGAPAAPAVTNVQPTCTTLTGTITINPWDNTLTYSVDGTNFFAGPAFSGLTPSTYNVIAKNSSGCVSSSTPVTITPIAAPPAAPTASTIQPTCTVSTGTITISPWDNTLTYSVDGTNFLAGPAFSGLAPSTYNIVAKNSNGCVSSSTPVTINPSPGTPPAAPAVTATQPTCALPTGTITINSWDNTLTYSVDGTNFLAGPAFSGLAPNTYNVVAKNSNGCVSNSTAVIINTAPGPAMPGVTIVQTTCFVSTGTITINPFDNTLTYSIDGTNFLAGPTFSTVAPNTYNVLAKNSSGCVSIATPVTITPSPATPLTPTAIALQPTCTVSTGSVTITPVVGLTYSIDGTNYFAYSNAAFSNLPIATYQLTAKNNSGCISTPLATSIVALSTPCPDFFIPNLITPNNDGKNDLFEITALPAGSSLTVVNRWGDNVYQSSNYDNLWTGSNASDGVYYYSLLTPDGKEYKSWLNIMR